ncbi:MAG: hypothetical protein BGO77_03565 [Caedibacter sp. 37-49]|nr:MAG: hypothetical protein BGO77_03565 [Caedibacter sp. 37-49]
MFDQNNLFSIDPNEFKIKEFTFQEPNSPSQPENPRPLDEKRNPNNPKPIDGEEPHDPKKETPILEDISNPNTNNNPGDNWDENHPIRPLID